MTTLHPDPIIDDILSRLLARGYQDTLFKDVQNTKQASGGRETLGSCPFCQKAGHFYYSNEKPLWICHHCKQQGDWFHYLEERESLDFRSALESLAQAAGVELARADPEKYKAYQKQASLFEAAQEAFSSMLFEPTGQHVLDYLRSRNFSEEDIQAMASQGHIGAYPSQELLIQKLQAAGFQEAGKEARASGLLLQTGKGEKLGDTHQLTIAWRDRAGRITGFIVRPIIPEEERKAQGWSKYLNTSGLPKSYSLAGFTQARGSKEIVVVESPIDVALAQARGLQNIIATGGTALHKDQLQALQNTGTKQIWLALDQDEEGQKAIETVLKSLNFSEVKAYIPVWPEGYKDPGELISQEGLDKLEYALDTAEPAAAWLARRIASRYELFTEPEQDRAILEALELRPKFEGPEARQFEEAFCSQLGIDREELAGQFARASEKAREEQAKEKLKEIQAQTDRLIQEGDLSGAEQALETGLQDLRVARGAKAPEPYLLSDLEADLLATIPGLETGYERLDKILKIPQGAVTLVAGRPGHGKTTLLLNLLARQLKKYPEKSFYFFSYEEAQKFLALKLIMILAGVEIDREFNQNAYLNYFQEKRGTILVIEQAIQQYDEWTRSGRLFISDSMPRGEDLAATVAHLARTGEPGAVLIDYIQKIPLRKPMAQRYLEIKRISELLLKQAVSLDLPIILGAQFNRAGGKRPELSDLREGGDLEQDANLVLSLYNDSRQQADEQEEEGLEPEDKPEVELEVQILKQRGGVVGRKARLHFWKPPLQINDSPQVRAQTTKLKL